MILTSRNVTKCLKGAGRTGPQPMMLGEVLKKMYIPAYNTPFCGKCSPFLPRLAKHVQSPDATRFMSRNALLLPSGVCMAVWTTILTNARVNLPKESYWCRNELWGLFQESDMVGWGRNQGRV